MDEASFIEEIHKIGLKHSAYVHECWQGRQFPMELWNDLHQLGLFSLLLKENLGVYQGMPLFARSLKALTYHTFDGGFPISLICHGALATTTLDSLGNKRSKELVTLLTSKNSIASYAITELHGGSDALRPQCILERRAQGGYLLNGTKWHITNAPIATMVIAFVKFGDSRSMCAVVVNTDREGISLSDPLKPVGTRTSFVGELHFQNYLIEESDILCIGKDAYRLLERAFLIERILTAWCVIGGIERCIEICTDFSRKRKVSGKPIFHYQHIQRRLVDMQISLSTMSALAERTMERFVAKQDVSMEASILKMRSVQEAVECAMSAMKLGGTYHIQEDIPFGRSLLDSLMVSIGGGTEEMHYNTIFKQMLKLTKRSSRSKPGSMAID